MEVIPPQPLRPPTPPGGRNSTFLLWTAGLGGRAEPEHCPGGPNPPRCPLTLCALWAVESGESRLFFFNPFLTHCTDSCTEHHLISIPLIPESVWNERNPSLSLKSLAFELNSELPFAAPHPPVTARPPAPQKPRLELQRSATTGRGVRQGGECHGMEKQPGACGAIGESRPAAPRHPTAAAPWATLANYPRL